MAENNNENIQPNPPRRRRKRSKWQDFKEAYLPVLIALVAIILIVVFISGSVRRAAASKDPSKPSSTTEPTVDPSTLLQQEADALLARAEALAAQYDYEGAMEALNTYSGGLTTNETLYAKYNEYNDAFSKMVPYTDINSIPVITFRHLIEDLSRALPDATYGQRYNQNYVTTSEFRSILQQLYDNNYMLVSLYDIALVSTDENGNQTFSQKTLYLPEGKKPLVLVQTGVNYFTYIVDGNGDGLADADSDGFACKLVVDNQTGKLTNEMFDSEGNVVTGSFDLIPILNDFVAEHPDFSCRGAKATIAVTGYDGLFGYRTDPETADKISQDYYQQQLTAVVPVIEKVREDGFDIACYTYDYEAYGNISSSDISADLKKWTEEVTPLLGQVDILIYANGSDIGGTSTYSGSKYEVLKNFGFTYYIGQDNTTKSWGQLTGEYLRLSSREVRGGLMYSNPEYYADLFDATQALDAQRSFS